MAESNIIEIAEKDAPKLDDPHRVVITFPDDHTISGMKVEVIGVTPEQIAVAVFHLSRTANQVADARQMQAAVAARELESIRRELVKGH